MFIFVKKKKKKKRAPLHASNSFPLELYSIADDENEYFICEKLQKRVKPPLMNG